MTCEFRDEDGEQCLRSAGHSREHVTLHWLHTMPGTGHIDLPPKDGGPFVELPYVRRRTS